MCKNKIKIVVTFSAWDHADLRMNPPYFKFHKLAMYYLKFPNISSIYYLLAESIHEYLGCLYLYRYNVNPDYEFNLEKYKFETFR